MMKALRQLAGVFAAWEKLVPVGMIIKLLPTVIFAPETRLLGIAGIRPQGFVHGIEILNDDRTTMEFVVWALREHVGLDHSTALERMLDIHADGGALLAMESEAEAERVAALVVSDARERNFPLICRAVSSQQSDVDSTLDAYPRIITGQQASTDDSRLLRAVLPGLVIAILWLVVQGISYLLGWITSGAVTPVMLSLAAAMTARGVAAEYSPYSGRLWGFVLGAGAAALAFAFLILWLVVAEGAPFGFGAKLWPWILGASLFCGILGVLRPACPRGR